MSDYINVREALADRPGWSGAVRLGGIDVIISPALPSYPTFLEDIARRVRHGMKRLSPDILRNFDPGPEEGDPTHAVRYGNRLIVSSDLYERLKEQAGD